MNCHSLSPNSEHLSIDVGVHRVPPRFTGVEGLSKFFQKYWLHQTQFAKGKEWWLIHRGHKEELLRHKWIALSTERDPRTDKGVSGIAAVLGGLF